MKFSKKNVLPSPKCITKHCKVCPESDTCDLIERLEKEYEPLTYKPFEILLKKENTEHESKSNQKL